jgi:hypothetical protein
MGGEYLYACPLLGAPDQHMQVDDALDDDDASAAA